MVLEERLWGCRIQNPQRLLRVSSSLLNLRGSKILTWEDEEVQVMIDTFVVVEEEG